MVCLGSLSTNSSLSPQPTNIQGLRDLKMFQLKPNYSQITICPLQELGNTKRPELPYKLHHMHLYISEDLEDLKDASTKHKSKVKTS